MLTSRFILGSAAAMLSLAAAAQAVQQQPGFFPPKADPNLTSPDPVAQPAQAGQAAPAAQPAQAPVMGPAQGVGQPAQAIGRVPGQPAVAGQVPAVPAAAAAAAAPVAVPAQAAVPAPAAAPAAPAVPAQQTSNAAVANDPTRAARWTEQQMDRSEQEAAQAKVQASTTPAPINGAFTGNTNERDR